MCKTQVSQDCKEAQAKEPECKVTGVHIAGRPPKSQGGSMGDHTTPFAIIAQIVANNINDQSTEGAILGLEQLYVLTTKLPGYCLHWKRGDMQIEFKKAETHFLDVLKAAKSVKNNCVCSIAALQQAVAAFLEYRELIPLSTLNTRGVTANSGRGHGESRDKKEYAKHSEQNRVLSAYKDEIKQDDKKDGKQEVPLGDKSGASAVSPDFGFDFHGATIWLTSPLSHKHLIAPYGTDKNDVTLEDIFTQHIKAVNPDQKVDIEAEIKKMKESMKPLILKRTLEDIPYLLNKITAICDQHTKKEKPSFSNVGALGDYVEHCDSMTRLAIEYRELSGTIVDNAKQHLDEEFAATQEKTSLEIKEVLNKLEYFLDNNIVLLVSRKRPKNVNIPEEKTDTNKLQKAKSDEKKDEKTKVVILNEVDKILSNIIDKLGRKKDKYEQHMQNRIKDNLSNSGQKHEQIERMQVSPAVEPKGGEEPDEDDGPLAVQLQSDALPPTLKGLAVQALPGEPCTTIRDIKFGGRAASPFSATMGSHQIAWVVLCDIVSARLKKDGPLTLGAANLPARLKQLLAFPGELKKALTPPQDDTSKKTPAEKGNRAARRTDLKTALVNLLEDRTFDDKRVLTEGKKLEYDTKTTFELLETLAEKDSTWKTPGGLQNFLLCLMTEINLITGVTVEAANSGGKGEGRHRKALLAFEDMSKDALEGLKTNTATCKKAYDAYLGLMDWTTEFSSDRAMLEGLYYENMKSLYPNSTILYEIGKTLSPNDDKKQGFGKEDAEFVIEDKRSKRSGGGMSNYAKRLKPGSRNSKSKMEEEKEDERGHDA